MTSNEVLYTRYQPKLESSISHKGMVTKITYLLIKLVFISSCGQLTIES